MTRPVNVKGLGEVVEELGDFYTILEKLERINSRLISPRDEAYARLQTRGEEYIGQSYGTWTRAGFEHMKGELPILRLESRLNRLELAKQAVQANRNGRYFSTKSTKEYEQSFKQAKKEESKEESKSPNKRKVIILPSRDTFSISTNENSEVLEAVLKDQASNYLDLNNGPIRVYPVDKNAVDSQDGTLLTQMWFWGLDGRSDFNGYSWNLDNSGRTRGVRKRSAVGTSQKITDKLPYNNRQLDRQLKRLNRIAQGKVKLGDLESEIEEVAEFLKGLKQ